VKNIYSMSIWKAFARLEWALPLLLIGAVIPTLSFAGASHPDAPVIQAQWEAIMGDNPSTLKDPDFS